ncbi:hypothetical protein NGF19_15355 [Streptomyces sp. RY43-2]|uniref:Uncharacterized protein n=1 Tax=Streptomyces macrolidinus TaxID=2952607 RepID=A0ABT0ZEY5_9ACTN|nr:hypothetical protein [Streptomyces macrolidinus]MCN9242150.1 hypothetical protein [Streptomyces macrolidinus]
MAYPPELPDHAGPQSVRATSWTRVRKGVAHPMTRVVTAAVLQAVASYLGRAGTPQGQAGPCVCQRG